MAKLHCPNCDTEIELKAQEAPKEQETSPVDQTMMTSPPAKPADDQSEPTTEPVKDNPEKKPQESVKESKKGSKKDTIDLSPYKGDYDTAYHCKSCEFAWPGEDGETNCPACDSEEIEEVGDTPSMDPEKIDTPRGEKPPKLPESRKTKTEGIPGYGEKQYFIVLDDSTSSKYWADVDQYGNNSAGWTTNRNLASRYYSLDSARTVKDIEVFGEGDIHIETIDGDIVESVDEDSEGDRYVVVSDEDGEVSFYDGSDELTTDPSAARRFSDRSEAEKIRRELKGYLGSSANIKVIYAKDAMDYEPEAPISSGDRVKLTREYADSNPNEIFTVKHTDSSGRRFWIADKEGRGWYVSPHQVTKVDEDEAERWDSENADEEEEDMDESVVESRTKFVVVKDGEEMWTGTDWTKSKRMANLYDTFSDAVDGQIDAGAKYQDIETEVVEISESTSRVKKSIKESDDVYYAIVEKVRTGENPHQEYPQELDGPFSSPKEAYAAYSRMQDKDTAMVVEVHSDEDDLGPPSDWYPVDIRGNMMEGRRSVKKSIKESEAWLVRTVGTPFLWVGEYGLEEDRDQALVYSTPEEAQEALENFILEHGEEEDITEDALEIVSTSKLESKGRKNMKTPRKRLEDINQADIDTPESGKVAEPLKSPEDDINIKSDSSNAGTNDAIDNPDDGDQLPDKDKKVAEPKAEPVDLSYEGTIQGKVESAMRHILKGANPTKVAKALLS